MPGILRIIEEPGDRIVINQDHEALFRFAAQFVPPDAKVLDIGCGKGDFAHILGNADVYLMDGNELTVKDLRCKWKNVYCARLPEVPFPAETFDVIHCSHVLEHLEPEVVYQSLGGMDLCLRRGGILILGFPLLRPDFYADLSHVRPYNSSVFLNYLVSDNSGARTRPVISGGYTLLDRLYRYHTKAPQVFFIERKGVRGYVLRQTMRLIKKIVNHLGLVALERSGEVIVLKKNGIGRPASM